MVGASQEMDKKQIEASGKATKIIVDQMLGTKLFSHNDIGKIRDNLRERFPEGKNGSKSSTVERCTALVHLSQDMDNVDAAKLVKMIRDKFPNSKEMPKETLSMILMQVQMIAEGKTTSVHDLKTAYADHVRSQ